MKTKIAVLTFALLMFSGCTSPLPQYNEARLSYLEARVENLEKTIEAQQELNTVLILRINELNKTDQIVIDHLNKVEELVKSAKNQHFL